MKLMTHVVVGHPSLKQTEATVLTMAKAGVDMIELQIPFSDPLADGPVIMQANQTALQNGITTTDCLNLMKRLNKQVEIPLLFMAYYNSIFNYGVAKFCKAARQAGAVGLIVPDMPIDEEPYEKFYYHCKKNKLDVIPVVSPATPITRMKQINNIATRMVYCMARYGVTGKNSQANKQMDKYLNQVRKHITAPIGVGFGISTPQHIKALRKKADVAIIGSALIKLNQTKLKNKLKALCASL